MIKSQFRYVIACSAIAFAAVAPAASSFAQDEVSDDGYSGGMDLHLVCYGEGDKPSVTSVPILHWSRRHHEFDTDYANVMSKRDFDGMVQIDIHGDEGHIWLPKKLIPPMHSRGKDGWWELNHLDVGYSEIRARYRLNGLNKPKLKIDRTSGHISIDGIENFHGTCQEQEEGQKRRF